jgi:hypothetical protein
MKTGTLGKESRKDEDRDTWEKLAQGMGGAERPSSTREWVAGDARQHSGSAAQGQSRREQGRGAPRGRVGQSRQGGTVVSSDIGEAQGQSRQGGRDSPGASREGGRHSPGASSGTVVDSDIGEGQGQLTWTPNGSRL